MGNENVKSEFDEENWLVINACKERIILRNKNSNSYVETYEFESSFSGLDELKEHDIYQWRKKLPLDGHVLFLHHYTMTRNILGGSIKQKVFTQKITRLSEITFLSQPEAFLLIEHTIIGISILFQHFPLFYVTVDSIGVTENGQGRVWLNQNYAKNYAQKENQIAIITPNIELTIVNNIIRMIKAKVDNQIVDYPFSQNFQNAIQYIRNIKQQHRSFQISRIYTNRNQYNQALQPENNLLIPPQSPRKRPNFQANHPNSPPLGFQIVNNQRGQINQRNSLEIYPTHSQMPHSYPEQKILEDQPQRFTKVNQETKIYNGQSGILRVPNIVYQSQNPMNRQSPPFLHQQFNLPSLPINPHSNRHITILPLNIHPSSIPIGAQNKQMGKMTAVNPLLGQGLTEIVQEQQVIYGETSELQPTKQFSKETSNSEKQNLNIQLVESVIYIRSNLN